MRRKTPCLVANQARCFYTLLDLTLTLHGREAVLIALCLFCEMHHIGLVAGDVLLIGRNLLRKDLDDLIFQRITLAQMTGLQQLQPLYGNVQIHLFFDIGVAGTKSLDLRIGQGGFVDVFGRTHRGFGGHHLTDELLLTLHQLIKVAVKGVLGNIGVDVYFGIFVSLADDTPLTLLQICGSLFADNTFYYRCG